MSTNPNYDFYLNKEYIESVLLCCPLKKYSNKVIDDPNINKSPKGIGFIIFLLTIIL